MHTDRSEFSNLFKKMKLKVPKTVVTEENCFCSVQQQCLGELDQSNHRSQWEWGNRAVEPHVRPKISRVPNSQEPNARSVLKKESLFFAVEKEVPILGKPLATTSCFQMPLADSLKASTTIAKVV